MNIKATQSTRVFRINPPRIMCRMDSWASERLFRSAYLLLAIALFATINTTQLSPPLFQAHLKNLSHIWHTYKFLWKRFVQMGQRTEMKPGVSKSLCIKGWEESFWWAEAACLWENAGQPTALCHPHGTSLSSLSRKNEVSMISPN